MNSVKSLPTFAATTNEPPTSSRGFFQSFPPRKAPFELKTIDLNRIVVETLELLWPHRIPSG